MNCGTVSSYWPSQELVDRDCVVIKLPEKIRRRLLVYPEGDGDCFPVEVSEGMDGFDLKEQCLKALVGNLDLVAGLTAARLTLYKVPNLTSIFYRS